MKKPVHLSTHGLVMLLGIAVSCADEKNTNAPSADAPGGGPAAAAAGRVATESVVGLSCDTLVPKELRDKYMPAVEMQQSGIVDRTLMCSANKEGQLLFHVSYDCRTTTTLAYWQNKMVEEKAMHPSHQDIPNLGRGAVGTPKQLSFYDDDTPCEVTAASYGETDVLELATALAQALKPELLPPPPKGRFNLVCDKLLPQGLRDKYFPNSRLEANANMLDSIECTLKLPRFAAEVVTYTCSRPFEKDFIKQMKAEYDRRKVAADEVDLGTPGLLMTMLGNHSISFVDPKVGCLVSLTLSNLEKAQALEFAKAVSDALTPQAVAQ